MSDYGSERAEVVEAEDQVARQQHSNGLRGFLGGPRVPAIGEPKGIDRLVSVNREGMAHIYKLFNRETVLVAFTFAVGTVSKFLRSLVLVELLIGEYADEGTAIADMRILMKVVQLKDETSGELGVRAEKMVILALPGELSNNAVTQSMVADLYVEALQNNRIRHDVIKKAPVKLSVAVALA